MSRIRQRWSPTAGARADAADRVRDRIRDLEAVRVDPLAVGCPWPGLLDDLTAGREVRLSAWSLARRHWPPGTVPGDVLVITEDDRVAIDSRASDGDGAGQP